MLNLRSGLFLNKKTKKTARIVLVAASLALPFGCETDRAAAGAPVWRPPERYRSGSEDECPGPCLLTSFLACCFTSNRREKEDTQQRQTGGRDRDTGNALGTSYRRILELVAYVRAGLLDGEHTRQSVNWQPRSFLSCRVGDWLPRKLHKSLNRN